MQTRSQTKKNVVVQKVNVEEDMEEDRELKIFYNDLLFHHKMIEKFKNEGRTKCENYYLEMDNLRILIDTVKTQKENNIKKLKDNCLCKTDPLKYITNHYIADFVCERCGKLFLEEDMEDKELVNKLREKHRNYLYQCGAIKKV